MQLAKSKQSALILSTVIVLSFTITTAVVDLLIPYLISGDIQTIVENPESLAQPGSILGLLAFLAIVILVLIAIGAYWLYRFFGERHYGRRSAVRWALFGISFALLVQALDLVFQGRLAILKGITQFLSIFGAYFLARWLIPLGKIDDRRPTKDDRRLTTDDE